MPEMKLWLLKAKKEFTGYLMNQNLVVRAETEPEARWIANFAERDIYANWPDSEYATCDELLPAGEPGVIIADNNGS